MRTYTESTENLQTIEGEVNTTIGWSSAIAEAERKIAEHRQKIARLEKAISTFREMLNENEPFPQPSSIAASYPGSSASTHK